MRREARGKGTFEAVRRKAPARHGEARGERARSEEDGAAERLRTVYGRNPVRELLLQHPERLERLFVARGALAGSEGSDLEEAARACGVPLEWVDRARLTALAGVDHHQGLVARVRPFRYADFEDVVVAVRGAPSACVIVLDGILDPQNLGAIARSASALGAVGLVIGRDRAAPITSAAAKASAGAIEHIPIAQVVNISRALVDLKEAGCWVLAADPRGTEPLWSFRASGPTAVVVGAEGEGVRPGVLKQCDFALQIPMAGPVASLNASVSAGILLYELARQRHGQAQGQGPRGRG